MSELESEYRYKADARTNALMIYARVPAEQAGYCDTDDSAPARKADQTEQ